MSEAVDSLETNALELNNADRIELASRLLRSVEPVADVEAAWESEIASRIERFDQGETDSIPAAEVFEGLARQMRTSP